MTTIRHLERAALAAHRAGQRWNDFWAEHGAAVCRTEPQSRQRFGRLVRRLLALVTTGRDEQRRLPTGLLWGEAAPWLDDDQPNTTTLPMPLCQGGN